MHVRRALDTNAGRQLARCFGAHGAPVGSLRETARRRLAANLPVDPNAPRPGPTPTASRAVLRRHGITKLNASRLELRAVHD